MSKVSMSEALMPATDEPSSVVGSPDDNWSLEMLTTSSSTTPSTTHSGLFSPLSDVTPRIRTLGALPKVLETFCTDTPATCPSSIRLTSVTPAMATSSAEILTDEPVKLSFFAFLKPVTTIWSITTSGFSFALTT